MADEKNQRRPARKPPSRPDPRGGPAAMLSALAVAGLLFAGAIALHYGKLPAFLVPATTLGEVETVEAPAGVTFLVSVPEAAKVGEPKAKAEREENDLATVAVKVENTSAQPIAVPGPDQSLRTDLARSYPSRTENTVEIAPGKTKTVKLQFLIPSNEDPATLKLEVAGQEVKLEVR